MYSLHQIKKGLRNPRIPLSMLVKSLRHVLPDVFYLKTLYRLAMNKKLDLNQPETFSEKLQWMKLYDRNPLYTLLVDKYRSKQWVAERIGNEHIIPIIGVYDSFDEIDFSKLPEKFVIKCSHNCGVVICKDKNNFDIAQARKTINKTMSENYFYWSREWPYKNVPRKVLVEQYMVDESGYELKDYKFFCFDGVPTYFFIATDRSAHNTCFDFFDMDFKHLPIVQGHPNAKKNIVKPDKFEEMIEIARTLSEGLKQVRVDLYNVNGCIYFGEMTFFHYGGMVPFIPETWDYEFGSHIHLGK